MDWFFFKLKIQHPMIKILRDIMSNFFHRLKCFKIKYNHEAMYLKKKYPTVYIEQDAIISAVESLTLGEHVNISRGLRLFCQGGVHIGSYTQIAINFTCYSDEHLYDQNDFIPVSNKKKLRQIFLIRNRIWKF